MKDKILLVEDETAIAEIMQFNLEEESHQVTWVQNGYDAISKFKEERFDLIILDIMLPKMSGFGVFESIRLIDSNVPVLFVSARNSRDDILKGLSLGADDYITKPFDLNEFLLRVKNNIIRSKKRNNAKTNTYYFANFVFYYESMLAKGNEKSIDLTNKEARFLKLLLDHQNEVVSRDLILEQVWGYDVYPTTRTIDNFILRLRKYFEIDPHHPKIFMSIRSVGYKMIV